MTTSIRPAIPRGAIAGCDHHPPVEYDPHRPFAGAHRVQLLVPELDGLWLHLDTDVLDDTIMPAVDYRMPGGLDWGELKTLLRAVAATGRLTGVEVTILTPELDPTGEAVRGLADCLGDGLH